MSQEISRRGLLTGGAALALAAAIPAAMATDAQAQQSSASYQRGRALFEVCERAETYSRENNAVGIVIAYGGGQGVPSASVIGERLIAEFRSKGINSSYFVAPAANTGAAALYIIDDATMGPFPGMTEARANIDRAVSLRRGANAIRSSELDSPARNVGG